MQFQELVIAFTRAQSGWNLVKVPSGGFLEVSGKTVVEIVFTVTTGTKPHFTVLAWHHFFLELHGKLCRTLSVSLPHLASMVKGPTAGQLNSPRVPSRSADPVLVGSLCPREETAQGGGTDQEAVEILTIRTGCSTEFLYPQWEGVFQSGSRLNSKYGSCTTTKSPSWAVLLNQMICKSCKILLSLSAWCKD